MSRASRLIGRDPALAAASSVVDDARRGAGQFLMISGEAGIGKMAMPAALIGQAGSARTPRATANPGATGPWPIPADGPERKLATPGGLMSFDTIIAKTRQAIADDPAKAHVVFTAQGTLVGVTEVDIRTGAHSFRADEPRSMGGVGAAANPVQYALASLGSCQAITYRFWAAQLGVTLDSITVRVEGDLDLRGFFGVDDGVRPGLSAVRVEVTVAGPESEERYAELATAVDEHCPVLDLFQNPVPVSRALHLADPAGNPAAADVAAPAVTG